MYETNQVIIAINITAILTIKSIKRPGADPSCRPPVASIKAPGRFRPLVTGDKLPRPLPDVPPVSSDVAEFLGLTNLLVPPFTA